MLTSNWTESLIAALANHMPPNVGVAGPAHSGGKEDILTYDFTHKTHIEVFGYHYPRCECLMLCHNNQKQSTIFTMPTL